MSFLELTHIRKTFADHIAVDDFNLEIAQGEFVSFLGPSGCGKTTTLRMVAGFEVPTSGKITINGHDITFLPPNKRNVGMVFQSYALFPNMTVAENIGYGLKVAGKTKTEIASRVDEMLALIHLGDFRKRYPNQLSGGQQQPHKLERGITPLWHRLEMLRRAIADVPGFEVSTVEVDRPGPHYTIDSLKALHEKYPGGKLVLLIGGDSLRELPGWNRPHEIIAAVHAFGVMRRPGDSVEFDALERVFPALRAKLLLVNAPQLDISSSTLRQRISDGGHYRYYLHPQVYDYIHQNHLYR